MIGHNRPAACGTFAKVEAVPTRGIYKFIVEVPEAQANEALAILGGLPAGGDSRWVKIALLEPEGNRSESQGNRGVEGDSAAKGNRSRPWHEIPPSQQAGIRCADPGFRQWLNDRWDPRQIGYDAVDDADKAAGAVRVLCNVASRSEFDTDEEAAAKWRDLDAQYQEYAGLRPEMRG